MKTIEKAMNEYVKKEWNDGLYSLPYLAAKNGFKAGVEFAQQWIDAKDELPDIDIPVLVKRNRDYNTFDIAEFCEGTDSDGIEHIGFASGGTHLFDVTHWRPINLK